MTAVLHWPHAAATTGTAPERQVRVLLVGEANPYSAKPEAALFPHPRNSAGARLCYDILGFERAAEYLRAFDRCDLCGTVWRLPDARKRAAELAAGDRPLVLLGAKVCQAFGVAFDPFTRTTLPWLERGRRGLVAVILPHPSGRCRIWGQPDAAARARALVQQLRGAA